MFMILPLGAFGLLWAFFYQLNKNCRSRRASFLGASLFWGILVALSTELLSLVHLLTLPGLSVFWLIVIVITSILLSKPPHDQKEIPADQLSTTDYAFLLSLAGIVIILGIVAVVAAPNNWDSMTYHMSRVAHWVQNKSVQYYPTSMPRHLWASPWAEYAIAQFQILSQSDRFANIVQWWSMLGSVLGVSLIAKSLGASRRGQLISAVVCASLPAGILESTSTQNDYAATFWMICFVYYGLSLLKKYNLIKAFLWSASLGLAVLTKTTTVPFSFFFILWLCVAGLKKHRRSFLPALLLLFLVPTILNAAHWINNYRLDGNILSYVPESKTVKNTAYTFRGATSNAIRYLGLNLGTPVEPINTTIENAVHWIHHQLNWDINDTRFGYDQNFDVLYSRDEDLTGNTAATVLLIISVILFFIFYRRLLSKQVLLYLTSLAGAFFIFCLTLKWQPWGNRFLLPLAVLSAPFTGIVLEKTNKYVGVLVAAILVLFSLPWLLDNSTRSLISPKQSIFTKDRNEQYFTKSSGMFFSYQRAIQEIEKSGCADIGLLMTTESWEYPIWPLLKTPHNKALRIEHINVDNPSKKFSYPLGNFEPCIVVHDTAAEIPKVTINGTSWVKTDEWAYLSLFRKDSDGKIGKQINRYNLKTLVELSRNADEIVLHSRENGGVTSQVMTQIYLLRQQALIQAKQLDLDELDRMYAGLGSTLRETLIKGTELFLEGLTENDPTSMEVGQKLLNVWYGWLEQHTEDLQKIIQ